MTYYFNIKLTRETIMDDFKVVSEKLYSSIDIRLKFDTFVRLQNIINQKFKESDYFVLTARVSIDPYIICLDTYVKSDYDASLLEVIDYDKNVIMSNAMPL